MHSSSRPGVRFLAWIIWGVSLGLNLSGLVVGYQDQFSAAGGSFGAAILFIFALVSLSVGLLVASKRPENPIGWFLLSGEFFLSLVVLSGEYAAYALKNPRLPGATVMAWIAGWAGNLGFGILILFTFLFFPDGRLPSERWRPLFWLIVLGILASLMANMLHLASIQPITNLAVIFFFFSVAAAVIMRYRRASTVVRLQIKWVAYSAILGIIVVALGESATFIGWGNEIFFDVIWITFVCSIPLTLGIAILRYRLYDIDLIIRRTWASTALTFILALVYFGGVVLLQAVFGGLTGKNDSALITVISTLAIAALFNPLRHRIRDFIDRSFYRGKYDSEQALAEFAGTARNETDLEVLTTQMVNVVQNTMQPVSQSLWIKDGHK